MATSSLSVRHKQLIHRLVASTSTFSPLTNIACRSLHSSCARRATPLPHPTVPGPPPAAPQAAVAHPQDRVARKKKQAEASEQSQGAKVNPSRPQTALQKRFWRNVSVKENEADLEVHLDTRPVRTTARQPLKLPLRKKTLARAIAIEWDQLVSAQQALKQHYIPLTSLTSRAEDIEKADREHGQQDNETRRSIVKLVLRYFETDTLLCWAPEKNIHEQYDTSNIKSLRERQREVANPIIEFLAKNCFKGAEINPILGENSILPTKQSQTTISAVQSWIEDLPAYELAALERGVLATKSFLVAARLMVEWSASFKHLRADAEDGSDSSVNKDRFGIDQASEAASLEVLHQTGQWGEVEDTHDVDKEDLRRQLGSVILLVS